MPVSNTPTPSDMLIPDLYLADRALSETSVIECEIASRNIRKLMQRIHLIYEITQFKDAKMGFFRKMRKYTM